MSQFQLYQAHNAIIDNGHELGPYAFVHQCNSLNLDAADAVGLNEQLVGDRSRPQDAPRRAIIMQFLGKEVAADGDDVFKLLLGIFHILGNVRAKVGII